MAGAKGPAAILEPRASATLDDYVADLAWSGDGTQLAIAGGEGRVFLAQFEAGAGRSALAVRQLGEHMMGALAVAWRPKSDDFVTSGQDNAIAFWDGAASAPRWPGPSRSPGRPTARSSRAPPASS